MNSIEFVDWPAPASVRACFTTRVGGVSQDAFSSFNLARHVGDETDRVEHNRRTLISLIGVPVCWLNQVHGAGVVVASEQYIGTDADAAWVSGPGIAAAVMTADCLPVFLCHQDGTRAAVLHAGWRGLLAGIIEATVQQCVNSGEQWMAYLGPAIGPGAFEVGQEVKDAYLLQNPANVVAFFPLPTAGKYLADIYQLARIRLFNLGIRQVYGGHYCTVTEKERFFSYRRDRQTGRMASLIWIE